MSAKATRIYKQLIRVKEFPWCGLSVSFQNGIGIRIGDTAECEAQRVVSIDQLKSYLLNGNLRYPKVIYKRLLGVGNKKDKRKWKKFRHDLLLLTLGVAGVEYVKTEGWKYSARGKDVPILVETVLGSVTLILQKNAECFRRAGILGDEEWYCAEKVSAVRLPRGRKVIIPAGYFVVFVNNSLNPAAVSIVVDKDAKEVPSPFAESHGAAYYAIKKNARQELVPNPQYRHFSPVSKIKPDVLWSRLHQAELEDLLYMFMLREMSWFEMMLGGQTDLESIFSA